MDRNLVERNGAGTHARSRPLDANAEREPQVVSQGFVILPGDDLVAARRFDEFLNIGDEWKSGDLKNVGAERGDALGDVAIHAIDERNDNDERSDGQNDAQERQERTHFVLAQSLQRDATGFAEMG